MSTRQTTIIDNNLAYQYLKKEEIHVHLSQSKHIDITNKNILDSAEKIRADSFKFTKDYELYVAAHIFLRKTLSLYAPLSPNNWQFKQNYYGKPSIHNHGYHWLQFNLSHTKGLIACAISYKRAIGIDVERSTHLKNIKALTKYSFSTQEANDILSKKSIQKQEQCFFTYWTLKEAYIKAKGKGLSIPLQQFTFIEEKNNKWCLYFDPELQDNGKQWQFFTYLLDKYHLAIGVESNLPRKSIKVRIYQ